MKCTVCQRDLAPSLSMCIRCGAMKGDSAREEAESSIVHVSGPIRMQASESREVQGEIQSVPAAEPRPEVRRSATSDLAIKRTSPTLAEFISRNAVIPDWRLQLQNSVRQRTVRETANNDSAASPLPGQPRTSGANALKIEFAEDKEASETARKVDNALKRIEASRRAYGPTEKAREGMRIARAAGKKHPFKVVARSEDLPGSLADPSSEPPMTLRPKLISSLKIEKKGYDTNKLVPIPEAARIASSFEKSDEPSEAKAPLKENWSSKIEIRENVIDEETRPPELPFVDENEPDTEEIDDVAPIAMRFNAGLFDLIIGGFASFILLSPFMVWSSGWISFSGFFLFATVLLAVKFMYLTASIAYLGQTFGMKIFSLELIDVEQGEFPTIHQAAVSSAVYLASLLFGGLGFIPILLNDEKRAAHDLISGTILVREI